MEYVTGAVNYTDSGELDQDYYRQAAKDIIKRQAEAEGIDTARLTTNQFYGLLRSVYRALFRPEGRKDGDRGHKAGKTGYTENEAAKLADIYIELCELYNVRVCAYGFSIMTGIDDGKTLNSLTKARSEISKATKNAVLNGLFDTPLGKTVLANNDPETGLMFARQQMLEAETIKKRLSFEDLKRIAEEEKPD